MLTAYFASAGSKSECFFGPNTNFILTELSITAVITLVRRSISPPLTHTHDSLQVSECKKVCVITYISTTTHSFLVEILNELHRAQECAYNLRDGARISHLARAKICSKLIKYPFIEDYTVGILILVAVF